MTGYRTNRGHTTLNVNYNLSITEMQSVFIKKWRGQSLINNRDLLITTQLFKLKLMCKDNNSFLFELPCDLHQRNSNRYWSIHSR